MKSCVIVGLKYKKNCFMLSSELSFCRTMTKLFRFRTNNFKNFKTFLSELHLLAMK